MTALAPHRDAPIRRRDRVPWSPRAWNQLLYLTGAIPVLAVVPLLLLRYALTLGSYALGTPGGIFAPLLALGALLGSGLGDLSRLAFPALDINPEALAVVGMAALFTGVVRAPLTGLVLVVEMTGNYGQMLPLMVACFTALAVAEAFKLPPVYEALLARELRRTPPDAAAQHADEGALLLTLTVQPESAFEGRAVRSLGLPPGCILVTLKRALSEQVITADTVLEAGDELTALVAPSAKGAVRLPHEGLG